MKFVEWVEQVNRMSRHETTQSEVYQKVGGLARHDKHREARNKAEM